MITLIKNLSLSFLVIAAMLIISYCSKEENPIIPNDPALTLIYPVGGESILADTTIKIKWSSAFIDSISIYLTTDNGNSWTELNNSVSAELGEWDWITPNSILDSCKIKIASKSDDSISDVSNSNFSIYIDATLELLTPNGGEVWESLTEYAIIWTSENVDKIDIKFTSDDGTTWNAIDSNVQATAEQYTWKTHCQPSQNYRIKIISSKYLNLNDESDGIFTIFVSPLVIESLNYYPLAIGNKWFYKKTFYNSSNGDTTISFITREVTDYIKMQNNKYYFLIVSDEYPNSSHERLDSLRGLVFRYSSFVQGNERLYDDLITEPGNIVYTWRFFDGIGPGVNILDEYADVILGLNTTTRFYGPMNSEVQKNYKLSKKFGLTYWWIQYWDTTIIEIKGALLDGIVYGDTILHSNVNKLK